MMAQDLKATNQKKKMISVDFVVRITLMVVAVCGLLFLAELTVPGSSLVIFLLLISLGLTWLIINLLKDDEVLTSLFD
jgi:hypothetical protein